ncbi:PKD domain-containing protein, partial [Flavobacteriales bacterium]|nr:PKD domain-containing protein [Flavobacteriales bacterium]
AGGIWGGTPLVSQSGLFTPSQDGIFEVIYSYGTGTCLRRDTMIFTVDPLPDVTVTPSGSLCIGQDMELIASGADTYDWSPSTGLNATSGATVTASPDSTATYTISGTNSTTGCEATANVTITVNPLPAVDSGPDQSFCNQPIPITLSGYSPLGGNWSGNGVTANGIFTPSQAGLGSINLIYVFTDSNGCISSDTIAAIILEPEQAFAGPDTSICQSSNPVILIGSPTSGLWSGSTLVSANGEFTPSLPGEYTLTYSYGTGSCLTIDERLITVDALPEVSVENDFDICVSEEPFELTGTPVNGLWSGTGVTNQNSGEFNPFVAGVGIHVITYQFTSTTTGCLNLDSLVISVNPLPNVNFDSIPISCLNQPVLFSNTSTGGVNFEWVFGDGTTSNDENPEHIYGDTGTFEITLIASSEFGCVDSISRLVTVTIPPVADFQMSDSAGCGPLDVLITNTSSASFSTYSWDFGNNQSSDLENPSVVTYQSAIGSDSTYYISLTVSNNCGIDTQNDSIVVYAEPVAVIGLNQNTGCSPLGIELINASSGFQNFYEWDFGDGSSSTEFNPGSHVFTTNAEDTTYIISMIATNICGTDTTTDSVTVSPNTITSFFNSTPVSGCSPLTVEFTNYSTQNAIYAWDFGDGNVSAEFNTSHTYFTSVNDTVFNVSLIVTNGCSYDTSSNTIAIYPQPILSFTASSDTVCSGDPISFTNTSSGLIDTYWEFGDGISSDLNSPTHEYETGGTYFVSFVGSGSINGCIDTILQRITVFETPDVNISFQDTFGCQPFQLTFNNSTQFADFYSWEFGDGNSSGLQNPNHTFQTNGVFDGILVASNNFGCTDTANFQVTVYPQPTSAFLAESLNFCVLPDTVQLTNQSNGSVGYYWNLGNGQFSTENNPVSIFQSAGDYNISLIAYSLENCSDTSYYQYSSNSVPEADFTFSSTDPCKPIFDFVNLSSDGSTFSWDFGLGETSNEPNPTHIFSTYGESTVTLIINPDGACTDSISRIVNHENGSPARVFVPNSFTPNNDGLNDSFVLKGQNECGVYILTVYDRWGKVLYLTDDLNQFWDGTYQGRDVKSGTYVYVLQSLTFRKTGKVTVIRN